MVECCYNEGPHFSQILRQDFQRMPLLASLARWLPTIWKCGCSRFVLLLAICNKRGALAKKPFAPTKQEAGSTKAHIIIIRYGSTKAVRRDSGTTPTRGANWEDEAGRSNQSALDMAMTDACRGGTLGFLARLVIGSVIPLPWK
ncbi:hypothetical protein RJ035_004535 [Blastomyces gilchristii]